MEHKISEKKRYQLSPHYSGKYKEEADFIRKLLQCADRTRRQLLILQ